MQDLHWRYNFNTKQFDFVENNPHQHYEPVLKHVHVPTLVIDINLVASEHLEFYVRDVLDRADANQIRFQQIIFDGTQDPVMDYKTKSVLLDNLAGQLHLPCYFALSQFDLVSHRHLQEINYPSWLFVFKKQNLKREFPAHARKHAFSCLNRNPSFHRLIFYSMIKDLDLLDRFIYSFYDRCPYQGHKISAHQFRNLSNLIGDNLAQRCIQNLQDFPIAWQQETLGENDHTINHAAYQDAWCNVVTETSAVVSFTSEKIWKPIAAGQLFLVVGAPGTVHWLRGLGFHTFEDHYDLKQNLASRLHLIAETVNRHRDDVEDWYQANRFHIEHNFHWFHSGNVEKKILDPLVSQLNGERS